MAHHPFSLARRNHPPKRKTQDLLLQKLIVLVTMGSCFPRPVAWLENEGRGLRNVPAMTFNQ